MSLEPYKAHASMFKGDEWGPPNTHPAANSPFYKNIGYGPSEEALKNKTGAFIEVGDGHQLWAQEFGNPKGEPVIYLHGGPGGGCRDTDACFFDPQRYRIILFDQRGCKKSKPTLSEDFHAAIKGNDTEHLVEDINKIRDHFGIKGKMHLAGGSWGTTLGGKYAIKYPHR